jgi:hypothetical protein
MEGQEQMDEPTIVDGARQVTGGLRMIGTRVKDSWSPISKKESRQLPGGVRVELFR